MAAVCYRAGQLAERIVKDRGHWIPDEFTPGKNLVYSSPATLAYNSPGAEGYGVKRAALCVPESVELIISPGCCGRNTSDISSMPGYENRFYYLTMDEADLVTGRHLKRIPEAVKRILADRRAQGFKAPKVVILVTTCVDALLGTDMDRVARSCEEECGVRVRPSYMYALTRDGVHPPMVQVWESIFSLLDKRNKDQRAVNILGLPGGLESGANVELLSILRSIGLTSFRSLRECRTYDDFMQMSEANFNLILDPQARGAASYMEERLDIGSVEMQRFYGIDRISSQYRAFLAAFGEDGTADDAWGKWGRKSIDSWRENIDSTGQKPVFAVGECVDAHAPELALSLIEYGYTVREVFCTLSDSDAYYVSEIADRSPDTKFYFNQHPSMVDYLQDIQVNLCIGKDAAWYYRDTDAASIEWNQDVQPFGYHGASALMAKIAWSWTHHIYGDADAEMDEDVDELLTGAHHDETPEISDRRTTRLMQIMGFGGDVDETAADKLFVPLTTKRVHGYRRVLTPFAPDQSGAESVIFQMNSLTVIIDAGGCTGNICGFDEPRWEKSSAMIFSAGLRDMDAVLGRDRELIDKIIKAAGELHPEFITLIGTPVPSVIGTDLSGIKRELEKKTNLPVVTVGTNGMDLYDRGAAAAYKELSDTFRTGETAPITGIWGMDFLDYSPREMAEFVNNMIADGMTETVIYGVNSGAYDYEKRPERNYAVSVSGYEAAGGVIAPPEYIVTDHVRQQALKASDKKGPVLIVGEQIYSNTLRQLIRERHPRKEVRVAGFFTMLRELMDDGDVHLKEEDDLPRLVREMRPSLIIGDPALRELLPDYIGEWVWRIHFALSGTHEMKKGTRPFFIS